MQMGGFFVLGGIVLLLLAISAIVLPFMVFNLRARVRRLEERFASGAEREMPPAQLRRETPPFSSSVAQAQPVPPSEAEYVSTGPTWFDRFVVWIKDDWLLKLGALLLLIGFGWFATYAFLHNWIGPMGRIALGIVAGAFILAFGWWRIRKFIQQGSVFLVLGSTVILLTIFAAREIYGFFTPLSALIVMFLSTAFVALASVRYKTLALALSSLILAGVAPFLTNSPSPNYIALFAYLIVVVLGAIWIVALTGWRALTTAALILITLYSLPHLLSFVTSDKGALLLFAYGFAAIFFITNTIGILRLKDKDLVPDLVTAAGNGLLLLAWIMRAAPEEWQSIIISAWMIVFAAGAFIIFRASDLRKPFYAYAGVCITMLAAATAAELSGSALTIAYTIESGLVVAITYAILRETRIAESMSWLLAGPAALSIQSIVSSVWRNQVFHKEFFVLFTLAAVMLSLGAVFFRKSFSAAGQQSKIASKLIIIGSFYAYLLLWLSLHAAFQNDDRATMLALVIYTLIGLMSYFYGRVNEKRAFRAYGGALLGFVVLRLLVIEVWQMELTGKIITFFLVGTLLVSTAFFGRKKVK